MRNALLSTITVLVLIALPATSARAQFCDDTIHNVFAPGCSPPCQGFWDNDDNWSDGSRPDCNDIACIPAGYQVFFTNQCNTNAQAKALLMEGVDGSLPASWFKVNVGCDLILCGGATSTIDGTLIFEAPNAGDLVIGDNLTIDGNGDIQLQTKIRDDGGATRYKLTLEDKDCGPNQEDLDDACAVVVHGNDAFIEVRLENNAIVSAEACVAGPGQSDVGLNLTTNAKDGHGIWRAECLGRLVVSTEVSGIGKWDLPNNNGGGTILIKDCLQDLTGPVDIVRGTLDAEQSFCTEGQLTWEAGGASSFITVHQGKQVMFSMPDCGSIPLCP